MNQRDYDNEMKLWQSWLEGMSSNLTKIEGVSTRIEEPDEGLSDRSPILRIEWDAAQLGITGEEVRDHLLDTEPRIVLGSAHGARPDRMASGVSVYALHADPGDDAGSMRRHGMGSNAIRSPARNTRMSIRTPESRSPSTMPAPTDSIRRCSGRWKT